VSASSLQCLVIASGERRCASVRKESMNVVVREAEGLFFFFLQAMYNFIK